MRVLAVDPGVTTGLAYMDTRSPEHIEATEFQSFISIYQYLEITKPEMIVCERFDRRSKAADLAPVEVIGVVKLWKERNPHYYSIQLQSASQAKNFWTNDKLKALNLYKKGRPHANDATRHLLWFVSFTAKNDFWLKRLDECFQDV